MNKEIDIIIFGVENEGDLKREYPELAEVEEFQDLKPKEVRFCWLVGNRTSPIFKLDRVEKINKALVMVWGKAYSSIDSCKEIAKGEEFFPDKILKGIYRMNNYNPEFRLKAKLMNEYIFEMLNEVIIIGSDELRIMDTDEKKKYTDLALKVSSGLQDMVERLEGSFGVKAIDRKTKKEVRVSINDINT